MNISISKASSDSWLLFVQLISFPKETSHSTAVLDGIAILYFRKGVIRAFFIIKRRVGQVIRWFSFKPKLYDSSSLGHEWSVASNLCFLGDAGEKVRGFHSLLLLLLLLFVCSDSCIKKSSTYSSINLATLGILCFWKSSILIRWNFGWKAAAKAHSSISMTQKTCGEEFLFL